MADNFFLKALIPFIESSFYGNSFHAAPVLN